MRNLGKSILKIGQKVKLDPKKVKSVSNRSLLRKHYKVKGFYYKGKLIQYDPTKYKPDFRDFSGILITDKYGIDYSVNRYQLKSIKKRK